MNSYIPTANDVSESKYVRKEDIPQGGIVTTISGFTKENLAQEGKPAENKVIIHFDGGIKPLVCNSTNWQILEMGLGKNAAEWIGRRIKLVVDPNVSFQGKLVGGVRVKTPSATPPQDLPPPQPRSEQQSRQVRNTVDNFDDGDPPF